MGTPSFSKEDTYNSLTKRSNYDPSNIPGHVLASIGRAVLTHSEVKGHELQNKEDRLRTDKLKDYTNIAWLDMRVEEVCAKGKL